MGWKQQQQQHRIPTSSSISSKNIFSSNRLILLRQMLTGVSLDEASFSAKNSNHSHINNDATTSGWKAINATRLCTVEWYLDR
jgi:hypothetical protein